MYVKFGARQEATAEKKDGEEGAESGTAEGGGKTADDIKKEDAAAAADAEIVSTSFLFWKTGHLIFSIYFIIFSCKFCPLAEYSPSRDNPRDFTKQPLFNLLQLYQWIFTQFINTSLLRKNIWI